MTHLNDIHSPDNGHILVAEDDCIIQMVVKEMLERAGYKADFVANGEEVISALKSKHYDLVVMDCLMPRMDGFAATRFIRNAGSGEINPEIPVIAMTGLTEKDDQTRCLDAGMNIYISKPVDSNTLISAIEQCLGRTESDASASRLYEMHEKQTFEDGFLSTLIDNFLAEVPQVIAGLKQAVKQGDVVSLQNIGHRLRGASDILGFSKLSTRSRTLEQAGKTGDTLLANRLVPELIKELQKLSSALDE